MAVLIKNGVLNPIAPKEEDMFCSFCSQKRAKWYYKKDEPWCAYCFLKETEWGKINKAAILDLAAEVEKRLERPLVEDGEVSVIDSDRILSSIVFTSLYKHNKERKNRENAK
jgi:hypothetical protein